MNEMLRWRKTRPGWKIDGSQIQGEHPKVHERRRWISSREAMEDAAIVEHLHSACMKTERL
jgi:hypothetical protein